MTKPAMVDAKEKISRALAGSGEDTLLSCEPPIPTATTKTTRTGNQAIRSNLK